MEWARILKGWIRNQKVLGCGCCRCGERDPDCLDFHHLEGKLKRFTIGGGALSQRDRKRLEKCDDELSWLGIGLPDVRKEISKCILICANCHRKLHAHLRRGGESPFWKWNPTTATQSRRLIAAALSGIEKRKRLRVRFGLPEPTADYGIGDTGRKFLNLMFQLRRRIKELDNEGSGGHLGSPFSHFYEGARGGHRPGAESEGNCDGQTNLGSTSDPEP